MEVIYIVALALFVLTVLELITVKYHATTKQKVAWFVIWFYFSLVIFALSATRVGGSDWDNYETIFSIIATADSLSMDLIYSLGVDPGYVFLNYIVSESGGDRRDLVILESGITSFATFLVLTKVRGGSIIVSWLMSLTFAGLMPVRQTVAISLAMIVFAIKSRILKVAYSVIGINIHISTIFLLLAKNVRGINLKWPLMTGIIISVILVVYFLDNFIAAKIELYFYSHEALTNLSAGSVVIGKVITLGFLTSLWYYASRKPKAISCPSISSYKVLHFLTMLSLVMCFINPAFARLTSLFEIVYIWAAAQNIYYLKSVRLRLSLYSLIVIVVASKLIKVLTQFREVYDVCFLCMGGS